MPLKDKSSGKAKASSKKRSRAASDDATPTKPELETEPVSAPAPHKAARSALIRTARQKQSGPLQDAKDAFTKHFTTTDVDADNYVTTDDYAAMVKHVTELGEKSLYYWYLMYLEGRFFMKWDVARKNNKSDGDVVTNRNGSTRIQLIVAISKAPFPWWDKYLAKFKQTRTIVRPKRSNLVTTMNAAPGMAQFGGDGENGEDVYATDGRWESVAFDAQVVLPSEPARSGTNFAELIPKESKSQFDPTELSKVKKALVIMPTVFNTEELSLRVTMCAAINKWLHYVVFGNTLANCLRDPVLRAALHSGKTDFAAKLQAAEDEHNSPTDPSSDEQFVEDVDLLVCETVHGLLGTENFRTPTKFISAPGDRKYEGNRRFYEALCDAHTEAGGNLTDGADNKPAPGLLGPKDIRISCTVHVVKKVGTASLTDNVVGALNEHFVCTNAAKRGWGVAKPAVAEAYFQQFLKNAKVDIADFEAERKAGNVTPETAWKFTTAVPGGFTLLSKGKHIEGRLPMLGMGTGIAPVVRFRAHNLGVSFEAYKAFVELRKPRGFKTPMSGDAGVGDVDLGGGGIDEDDYFNDEGDKADSDAPTTMTGVGFGAGAGAGAGAGNGFHSTSGPAIMKAPSVGGGLLAAVAGGLDDDDDE